MHEPGALAVEPQHPGVDRALDRIARLFGAPESGDQEVDCRLRHDRRHQRGLPGQRVEAPDALRQQLAESLRDGERLPGVKGPTRARQRIRQLDREEWIASGCFVHAEQQRSWERDPDPSVEDVMKFREAQWAEANSFDELSWKNGDRSRHGRRVGRYPGGGEEPDPLLLDATEGEGEGGARGRVEPLDVVDREQHGAVSGKRSKRAEEGNRYGVRVRCLFGRGGPQQGHVERQSLRLGKLWKDLVDHVAE